MISRRMTWHLESDLWDLACGGEVDNDIETGKEMMGYIYLKDRRIRFDMRWIYTARMTIWGLSWLYNPRLKRHGKYNWK